MVDVQIHALAAVGKVVGGDRGRPGHALVPCPFFFQFDKCVHEEGRGPLRGFGHLLVAHGLSHLNGLAVLLEEAAGKAQGDVRVVGVHGKEAPTSFGTAQGQGLEGEQCLPRDGKPRVPVGEEVDDAFTGQEGDVLTERAAWGKSALHIQ